MNSLLQDLRYAVRTFASTRGLTATAILSLALAIGANTAIFSVASARLLRPLPYQDPERLAILWNRSPGLGIEETGSRPRNTFDIRSAASSFEQVALAIGSNLNRTGDGNRNGSVRSAFHRICFPRSAPTRRLDVRSPTPMPPKARPAPPSCITARGCGGTGEIRRPSDDRSSSTASLIRSSAVWRVRK